MRGNPVQENFDHSGTEVLDGIKLFSQRIQKRQHELFNTF